MTSGEGEGLLKLASFRLMTLFVVVSLACLITWLNSRERTTFTEPSPIVRHAPPYEMKEMAIDVCLDRGWPVWHTRLSMGVMAHNANLYIEDFGTPEAKPRYGGTFGLTKEAGTREYSLLGIVVDAGVGLVAVLVVGFLTETAIRRRTCRVGPTGN